MALQGVTVVGESESERIKSQGFALDNVDAISYQNLNTDVNQVLSTVSGVNIRQTGGLGSNAVISINGISGNKIKLFMDEVPMENFGTAMSLYNYPVNLIQSIDVYKGVVPVSLSTDALGGVINIVTPSLHKDFLDASYSYGSFNTHRASLFAQKSAKNGLFFRLTSFYNYSDNDYWMDNVPFTDELGNFTGYGRARRFNDAYRSQLVNLRLGVLNKKFADQFSVGFNYAGNYNEIQHPELSTVDVYGGLSEEGSTYLMTGSYLKNWDKFELKANGYVGKTNYVVYDTMARNYDWSGTYRDLTVTTSGEYFTYKSILHVDDDIRWGRVAGKYAIADGQEIVAQFAHNYVNRRGNDELNEESTIFKYPNFLRKSFLGISYDYTSKNNKLKSSLFGKRYWFDAEINAEEYVNFELVLVKTVSALDKFGGGLATNYTLNDNWNFKASYEYAYRMPEPNEILGDGFLTVPSPNIQPEFSNNLNLGVKYKKSVKAIDITSEGNFFYRPTENNIRPQVQGITTFYVNDDFVLISGVESTNSLKINDKYNLGVNVTYQRQVDRSLNDQGGEGENYGEQIPNQPIFFTDVNAGYVADVLDGELSVNWTTKYVDEFFRTWASDGDIDTKDVIPTQFIHNINLAYGIKDGMYNVSFTASNIFDAEVYDNFSVQNPGRAFYVKFRYHLNKF